MQILNELLSTLTVGLPQVFRDVEIFPLLSSKVVPSNLLELDEVLEQELAEVVEVSEDGDVPELTVINRSPRDIIIFDGEQLIGAKQNRVVNTTVIIPANSTIPIPVSCVEQGRWHYKSRSFATSDSFAYPSLRRSMHEDVTASMRGSEGATSDQSAVWHDLDAKARRMSISSPTMAMQDLYSSSSPSPDVLQEAFNVDENQIGYIAFIKGGFAGGDVFGSKDVCRRKMEKLVRGYYLDSLDEGVAFERIEIPAILDELRNAQHDDFGTVGKGVERRFDAPHVQGSWKEVDGAIQHLIILPQSSGGALFGDGVL